MLPSLDKLGCVWGEGESVSECAVVFGGKGVRLWVSYGVCRELSGVLCDRYKVSHRNYSGSAYHTLCSGYFLRGNGSTILMYYKINWPTIYDYTNKIMV